jgi:hypothetical protein
MLTIFKRYGLEPISKNLEDIPLARLHFQYVPMAQPEKFWYGMDMMALRTSPHVELLTLIREHGFDWKVIMDTPYVAERRERRTVHGRSNWTDSWIREHIKRRWQEYKSLKKHGYKKKLHITKSGEPRPVLVLKEPFWQTRFNLQKHHLKGPEIFDGGGRCAAAYVLGWKTIPGLWVRDAKPGSCECHEITKKFA